MNEIEKEVEKLKGRITSQILAIFPTPPNAEQSLILCSELLRHVIVIVAVGKLNKFGGIENVSPLAAKEVRKLTKIASYVARQHGLTLEEIAEGVEKVKAKMV